MIGNKAELARALQCSLPTVEAILKRHPDFPVLKKGTVGRAYEFDLDACIAFLRTIEAGQAAAGAARDELMRQYTLPGAEPAEEKASLKPSERLTIAKVRALERGELKEAGFLVSTSDVRQALASAFTRLRAEMAMAVRQTCRDYNIPEPTIRSMEARIAEAQRRFVLAEQARLRSDDPLPGDGASALL